MVECNCKFVRNLVGFANSRPPCVVFTLCLAIFAVGLFSLGYYVQTGRFDEENSRWRIFVGHLAQKEFCMFSNITTNNKTNGSSELLSSPDLVLVSLPIIVRFFPGSRFHETVNNVSHVTTLVKGSDLGLTGEMSSSSVNLTFSLQKQWSVDCGGAECPNSGTSACGLVALPADMIPYDMPHNYCNMSHVPVQTMLRMSSASWHCSSGIKVRTFIPRYLEDHRIEGSTDMGLNDWSTVNLRLQYSSYFLFVMAITCILYGMIRGRPLKQMTKKINGQTI